MILNGRLNSYDNCDIIKKMKKTTKTKIGDKLVNITIDLLEYFYNVGGNTFDATISKQKAREIFYGNYYQTHTEVPFAKWLYRLRDQGYITYTPGSDSFEFTLKTKMKLIDKIGNIAVESIYYHFVSFDIPEKFSKARNAFRRALKALGFKRIQDSFWVINKDVYSFVQEIAFELKVEKYIVNIISAQSDIDGVLNKMFIN